MDKKTRIKKMKTAHARMSAALNDLADVGYNNYNPAYNGLQSATQIIKSDINGLQSGAYPFVKVAQ